VGWVAKAVRRWLEQEAGPLEFLDLEIVELARVVLWIHHGKEMN
jgi:hypothetical protein